MPKRVVETRTLKGELSMDRYKDIEEFLKNKVTSERFLHSKRVADLAVKLAIKHEIDPNEAYLAGLLHDICRELSGEQLLLLAKQNNIEVDQCEKGWPIALHGKVASKVYGEKLSLNNAIQEAIAYHVTGYPGMGPVARIVYLADKLEEERGYPGIDKVRILAFVDYNRALLESIELSILYLLERHLLIHTDTILLRNSLIIEIYKKV